MANKLRSNVTKPIQMLRDDSRLAAILELIQVSFSYMDGRINPRSSMHKLTLDDVAVQCETGEVWAIGNPIKACMFLTDMGDSLLLGKLAVAIDARGNGLARGSGVMWQWGHGCGVRSLILISTRGSVAVGSDTVL